jgi:GNAT superfamily N-acetyltransferase
VTAGSRARPCSSQPLTELDLVDVAENAFVLLPDVEVEREVHADLVMVDQVGPAVVRSVARLQLAPGGVDDRVAFVRGWFAARGRLDFTWYVGTRSLPSDLEQRLLAAGAAPDDHEPEYAAMVLTDEPPAVEGIDVRLAETVEDALAARDVLAEAFAIPLGQAPSDELVRRQFPARQAAGARLFLAYADGRVVGRGACVATELGPIELLGGCVLDAYRGRGVYRALVRARWDVAVERGMPVLVTQAGKMSKPILERLGFRQVGTVRALVDRAN